MNIQNIISHTYYIVLSFEPTANPESHRKHCCCFPTLRGHWENLSSTVFKRRRSVADCFVLKHSLFLSHSLWEFCVYFPFNLHSSGSICHVCLSVVWQCFSFISRENSGAGWSTDRVSAEVVLWQVLGMRDDLQRYQTYFESLHIFRGCVCILCGILCKLTVKTFLFQGNRGCCCVVETTLSSVTSGETVWQECLMN